MRVKAWWVPVVGAVAVMAWVGSLYSQTARPPVRYLVQGWTQDDRSRFYTTSQGSQLVPYAWYLALEQPGAVTARFNENSLARYGYLENQDSKLNPDRLAARLREGRRHRLARPHLRRVPHQRGRLRRQHLAHRRRAGAGRHVGVPQRPRRIDQADRRLARRRQVPAICGEPAPARDDGGAAHRSLHAAEDLYRRVCQVRRFEPHRSARGAMPASMRSG